MSSERQDGGNNYYFGGGMGGSGGESQNGAGGTGGQGMGASLSLDIHTRNLSLNNNLHIDDRNGNGFETAGSRHPNAVDTSYIQQNIHHHGDRGINVLHRSVALAAIYDSAESYPHPRCHPETRTEMLKGLRGWALDGIDLESEMHSESESSILGLDGPADPECRILWLYGPAGAGKSAIMQTLAGQLRAEGRLGGCFFFKRGHATRGNEKTLFATIAYQLTLNVGWLRTPISQIVENDPSIVVQSIATQMKRLISEPCCGHSNRDFVTILVDGLDECEGQKIQVEILRIIRDSCSEDPLPIRFIIASRPEPHIREMFDPAISAGECRSFNVEQSFEDVRKYLYDEFSRIHREHCIMRSVPSPWPSRDLLEKLVHTSSGHFIYAATVIKFVDDKSYRPTQRLAIVLDANSLGTVSAFDTLDQLYMAILSSAPRQAELSPILCAIANFDLTIAEIDQLFDLANGDTKLLLRGLHSVLQVPSNEKSAIRSHHASFLDFLNDSRRSHNFYVGGLDNRMDLARCFLRLCASQQYQTAWSSPLEKRRPYHRLIPFLISLPSSDELCLLIARMEPDCIFALDYANFGSMLSWLKKIPSVPRDLTNLWTEYVYMSSLDLCDWAVEHIDSPDSVLYQALVISGLLRARLWVVPRVLGVTWTEFRTLLCRVRPNIASDEQVPRGRARDVVEELHPSEIQRRTCRDMALKCIRRIVKSLSR